MMRIELEGFINGITDKDWYHSRGCTIWNEWCNPEKIPKGLSKEVELMTQAAENDLGPIYGSQWRNYNGEGYDQLQVMIDTLKTNPDDRRMICTAWNPLVIKQQALPACHTGFTIVHINGTLHMKFDMRSVDTFLGLPFNLASYALLLHLICKEVNMTAGTITASLADVHLYENQMDVVNEQLSREPMKLPTVVTEKFTSIFEWKHTDTAFENYQHHPALDKVEVAV